jgi:hypothetical protein
VKYLLGLTLYIISYPNANCGVPSATLLAATTTYGIKSVALAVVVSVIPPEAGDS